MGSPQNTYESGYLYDSLSSGVSAIVAEYIFDKDRNWTPNYAYKVREGKPLAILPYFVRNFRWDTPIYSAWNRYGVLTEKSATLRQAGGPSVVFPNREAVAASRATQSFFEGAGEFQTNAALMLAEAPKTIDLIGHTAFRLATAFRHLKRLRPADAFKALGASPRPNHLKQLSRSSRLTKKSPKGRLDYASNAWLEMTYGWTPLLMDVHSIATDLGSRLASNPADVVLRGGATEKYAATVTKSRAGTSLNVVTNECSVRVGYTCYAKIISDSLRTAGSLGLTNPVSLAWELLPFSFVVDWFTPVGPYLDSFSGLNGLAFAGGSKSVLKKHRVHVEVTGIIGFSQVYRIEGKAIWIWKDDSFQRTKLLDFPDNRDILRIKGLEEVLGVKRAISSLALLKQQFR